FVAVIAVKAAKKKQLMLGRKPFRLASRATFPSQGRSHALLNDYARLLYKVMLLSQGGELRKMVSEPNPTSQDL
ncbi:MAG: hypothetical protein ACSHYA_07920, partial [Opitutaceae bacterium]